MDHQVLNNMDHGPPKNTSCLSDEVQYRLATVADAPAIARVHVDSWRQTYRGLLPVSVLAGLSYDARQQMWQGALSNPNWSGTMWLAHTQQQVVGFAVGGPARELQERYHAELWAIYLLHNFQKQGVGRNLFMRLAQSLYQRGYRNWFLWVVQGNPTMGFYEHMGGQAVAHKTVQMAGQPVTESAYGWDRLEDCV